MGGAFSNLRSLSNTNSAFRPIAFYNEVFRTRQTIYYCVVRADAGNNLGQVFTFEARENANPGPSLNIARSRAYNSIESAAAGLRANASNFVSRLNVMLVEGNVNSSGGINFTNNVIICAYWNFTNIPPISSITVTNESIWGTTVFGIVNMNINGNVRIVNNSDFAMANSYLATPRTTTLRAGVSVANYILNSEIRGGDPLFELIKSGSLNTTVNIARSRLQPGNEARSSLFTTVFSRAVSGAIIVNMINTTAFGNRLNDKRFVRTDALAADVDIDDGVLDVYWYNNIIGPEEPEEQYIAKPSLPDDNEGNNFLINATVLGDKHIDNRKFVKYRYVNKDAEIITNSDCVDNK